MDDCEHGMPYWLGCNICRRSRNKKHYTPSGEWLEIRDKVFKKYGRKCMKCDKTDRDGVKIQVDHIEPKSLFPEKEFDFNNLQVLCRPCNFKKSNKHIIDYRWFALRQ